MKVFVKDLKGMPSVHSFFKIMGKQIKTARNGKEYLELVVGDKTGTIIARRFGPYEDSVDEANHFIKELSKKLPVNSIFEMWGKVDEYPKNSGKYNMIVNKIISTDNQNINPDDYIPESMVNKSLLKEYILDRAEFIKNPELKELLGVFYDSVYFSLFCDAPAARGYHHNYEGGLLEHTVNVTKGVAVVCHQYKGLDCDLSIVGAILHDIGKISVYQIGDTGIEYTSDGEFLDHIYLGTEILKKLFKDYQVKVGEPFPADLERGLIHMVLSHHGDVEQGWGSAVSPVTAEAVLLHYVDNLDAKVKQRLQEVEMV